jgi:hypothetical protein
MLILVVEGRRARSNDRPIDRSTDRFDSIPHFGPGPEQDLLSPTGYYASLGGHQSEDSESLRATRAIDRSTDRFDSIPHFRPGPQQALM